MNEQKKIKNAMTKREMLVKYVTASTDEEKVAMVKALGNFPY